MRSAMFTHLAAATRALAALAALAAASGTAHAQDVPYTNHLVGDRALGLAGAFVGLAHDASATFHNPGGLALLPSTSISASFWVVAHQRRAVKDAWRTSQGVADLDDDELTTPPLAITAVAKLGPSDALGRRNHAVGLAILKPHRVYYDYAAALDPGDGVPGASDLAALDVEHRDSARWYGLAYSYAPPSRRLSFGVSGFFVMRSLDHEEVEVHAQDGPLAPTSGGFAIARHSVFEASFRYLAFRLGVMWNPSPRWRFGVMVQPPGLEIGGRADNREVTFDIADDGTGAVGNAVAEDLAVRRPLPWEIRLGGTYRFRPRALITLDITVHGGAGSRDEPIALLTNPAGVPAPRMLAMETYLAPSLRAAVGGQFVIADTVPVRGGLLVARSGLPDVPGESAAFAAPDINTVGASLGVGVFMSGGHELTFGATATYGWGRASALDQTAQTAPGQDRYLATDASESAVIVFVSGGKRAAKQIARQVLEKGKGIIETGADWLWR